MKKSKKVVKKSYPTNAQRSEISRYIEKWRRHLFLHQWRFEVRYVKEKDTFARIEMQHDYSDAIILVSDKLWDRKKEDREHIIVHELCHCVVLPLIVLACHASNDRAVTQREIDLFKEQVTQHIANSLFYKTA